jgi:hypothetical protein
MAIEYSIEICQKLKKEFDKIRLFRPMQIDRYEENTELKYEITSVSNGNKGTISLQIIKFVGGGFAGQVYQVKVNEIISENLSIDGLEVGKIYAIKILIPPSKFSQLFRNVLYAIGFQGPFQLQSNPAAARSGALWQQFIRRGAKIKFGEENSVTKIYATFVDQTLGSCGEISEWIEGRTWKLEVDDRLDLLGKWTKGKLLNLEKANSPEFRAKYKFMHDFVDLLHEMGAHEFARQYEWSTWKSQPNCLKRANFDNSPDKGLVAVDFRAGLALLPFLPMSPGDVPLIVKGILRGSLVQFDRGSIKKLEKYISFHKNEFRDMDYQLKELKESETIYRNSIPDITHNLFRLLYSRKLWSTMLKSAITGWRVRNIISDHIENQLRNSNILTILFWFLGLIPFLGRFLRRIWGHSYWRKHYGNLLTSWKYFKGALRAKIIERILSLHRSGRVDGTHAEMLMQHSPRLFYHIPLSILPVGIHMFLTDWQYVKERLDFLIKRPIRLYFNSQLREQWLRDMVSDGKKKNILADEDAETILSQIKEPFIQKYLKSLAVHVCTVPVTQVVSVLLAIIYIIMHPEMPRAQAYAMGVGIIALFQVVPISPGSLVRGLYVVYLVIKERNFKDYNIAVFLGFFKYIGYLAFPIQMTYRYPALARFMAGHWATEAVHIVPVFGERGALLEHKIFGLFYNWPLTIRRRMRERSRLRSTLKPRYWHISIYILASLALFGMADLYYLKEIGQLPTLKDIWEIAILIPLLSGSFITIGAAGASFRKRILAGIFYGISVGFFYTIFSTYLDYNNIINIFEVTTTFLWRIFIFPIVATIGLLATELMLPEPKNLE